MARTSADISAPLASNLNNLANNASKPLGVINFETNNAHAASVKVNVQLAASGIATDGTIVLYFIGSQDGVDWDDGIDPTATSDVSASIKNAKRLATLDANANSQLVKSVIDLFSVVGSSYEQGCVIVWNKSGAALPASGHDADYQTVNYG